MSKAVILTRNAFKIDQTCISPHGRKKFTLAARRRRTCPSGCRHRRRHRSKPLRRRRNLPAESLRGPQHSSNSSNRPTRIRPVRKIRVQNLNLTQTVHKLDSWFMLKLQLHPAEEGETYRNFGLGSVGGTNWRVTQFRPMLQFPSCQFHLGNCPPSVSVPSCNFWTFSHKSISRTNISVCSC